MFLFTPHRVHKLKKAKNDNIFKISKNIVVDLADSKGINIRKQL